MEGRSPPCKPDTTTPIAMPPSKHAITLPPTARRRLGVTRSVHAIVPCLYSPAPATTPRISVRRP